MKIRIALFALVAACSTPPPAEPPAPSTPASAPGSKDARAQANHLFVQRCTPCHGATGAGDGSASATLTPKPRNFQDMSWQRGVTDEHIQKIIAYGGQAVGKSAAMPPNPDLADKTDVVAALKDKVRGFGRE